MDIVVFNEIIKNRIIWDNGSKRFSVNDVSSAFELKFVKNKPKFPTKGKVRNLEEKSREELLESLDFGPNKIEDDLEELRKLDKHGIDDVYLLIFSNKNYLYLHHGGVPSGEKDHKYHSLYKKLGKLARNKMESLSEDNVNGLYMHPLMEKKGKWIA